MSLKNRVLLYLITFCYFFIFMSTRLFLVCFFVRRFVCLYAKYLQKYQWTAFYEILCIKNTHTPGTNQSITVDAMEVLIKYCTNRNFDLDKPGQKFHRSLKGAKSITKLVIFRSFVAKCCKMRII
jgi:hypothetical protein